MITSRKIEDLADVLQPIATELVAVCKANTIDLLITCTLRDGEAQTALYAQGRTKPGKIVTWAKAGESLHEYAVAFDVVPLRNGKPVWGTKGEDLKIWQLVGTLGKELGLEWAGDWSNGKREFPHFQYTGGLTLADFKAGKMPQ